MPDLPAEAVHLSPERVIEVAIGLHDGPRVGADAPRLMAKAVLANLTEYGFVVASPDACPSAAPESTQSPENPSAAPVYPPGPANPAETLSALRALDRVRTLHNPVEYGGMTICAACSPFHEGGVRRYVLTPYPCPTIRALDGSGAVSEEQTGPVRHLGGNAEDCPACDLTTMPYPFLCPGEERTPPASTTEETNR
jgi:hypothetical protein